MLGPEGRRQHSSASQVVGRAAAGPGMGPAPAVSPHPRSRAARGAPFAAQPEDSCAHPAAAPALRLHPDAALAALLGEGRHAALLLSVAWVAAYGFAARGTQAAAQSLLYVATSEVALRFSLVVSLLVHEWAHCLAALAVSVAVATAYPGSGLTLRGAAGVLRSANLRGNVPLRHWAAALRPSWFLGARRGGLAHSSCVLWTPPAKAPDAARAAAVAVVRAAGPAASLALALAAHAALAAELLPPGPAGAAAAAAPWLVLAAGIASDLLPSRARSAYAFFCGNFGCILNLANGFVHSQVEYGPLILERMCAITQVRGGQAAGIASMTAHSEPGKVESGAHDEGSSRRSASRGSSSGKGVNFCVDVEAGGSPAEGVVPPPMLSSARRRLVNTKRGDMPVALRKLYVGAAGRSYPAAATSAAFIGHTRFATASLPAVMETHPHEWTPFGKARVWTFEGGAFVQSERPCGIHLTHNGDLDDVHLFHRMVPVGELGLWLERVLHCPNSTRGDSPKGAGMMELLTCQGSWAAAVRYSYQDVVATAVTEASGGQALSKAAPNTAPTRVWAAAWASVLDPLFQVHQGLLAQPYKGSSTRFTFASVMPFVEKLLDHLEKLPALTLATLGVACDGPAPSAALRAAAAESHVTLMAPLQLRKFLKRAAEAFLQHDVYESLRVLLSRSAGSFGISVLNALEPDTVAIAAWGQQMSLALHEAGCMALFGSEAAALKVPIRRNGNNPAQWEFMTHRLDLDETYGEVMRLSMRPRPAVPQRAGGLPTAEDAAAAAEADAANQEGAPLKSPSKSRVLALRRASRSALQDKDPVTVNWNGLQLSSYRMRLKRDLAPWELRRRLVPLLNNPLVQPLPLLSGAAENDPVGADIEAIPEVLKRIREEWGRASSLNRMTATAFARILLEKMALNTALEMRDIDLLVVGVETSLWLAEQFVADLKRALPKVAAEAISANKITQMLGCDADIAVTGFPLNTSALPGRLRNCMVLVVSQSGQTFPGLHATRLLRHMVGERVFVLTGEYDTKMGLVVGQDMARAEPFCARIFSNFSGWRPAEPTTVAAAAAHATLTELLLFMLHAYTIELSPQQALMLLGITMPRDDVRCLAELRDASIDETVPAICLRSDGTSVVGLSPSAAARRMLVDWTAGKLPGVHERLVDCGKEWAQRINETWHATVFSAFYVFGTIFFSFAPMHVVSVVVGCGDPFWEICPLDGKCCAIGFALRLVDVIIYVWIGWAFLLLRRKLRGTDVFARRGKRVLVIADVPWVHQSLEIYVSKLFALSYGDNGLDVHGTNPVDSFVHRFTHRVQRGVMVALGRPDGRLSALTRTEGACLLAAMQGAAIQNMGTGPEIISVGHNTARGNPGAIREHVVLPTHRRLFTCEFLAKAAKTSTPEDALAALGAGRTTTKAMMYDKNRLCDRCAVVNAHMECMQCAQSYCRRCHLIMHLRGDASKREHTPLPLLAVVLMRASAQRARMRLLERAGVTAEQDEAEASDPTAPRVGHFGRLGAGAGSAFPGFGALAGGTVLSGHGKLLHAEGAPLGVHHARTHLADVAAQRARNRWRCATRVLIWRASPWKSLVLHVKQQSATLSDGSTMSEFAALYREYKSTGSKAVLDAEATMKDLFEGRLLSFERYISFLVLFHAMALRVSTSSWPLPPWDISRSQSILRVASTAAPVSGAEVAARLAGEPASTQLRLYRRMVEGKVTTAKTQVVEVAAAVEDGATVDAAETTAMIRQIAETRAEEAELKTSMVVHERRISGQYSDADIFALIPPPPSPPREQ